MMSSYFQSTYNSGRIAQTYLLASKVKAKLTQEAVRNDVDLHRLVCQANLLDNLIENLNHHESSYNSNTSSNPGKTNVCYDSINSNSYPLLNNVTVQVNDVDYVVDGDADSGEEDDEDDEVDENEIKIERAPCSDVYYTSDDSDFDSDDDSDSSFNSDTFGGKSSDPNELCCIALQRLNLHGGVEDGLGEDDDDLENQATCSSVTATITLSGSDSDSESNSETESDTEYENENENDSRDHGSFSNNYCALMRMHSQHTSLNLNDYVASLEADTSVEETDACNNIPHNSSLDEMTREEDLPSLSNCSSFSSMEEIGQPNQNIVRLDCLDSIKHQHDTDSPSLYLTQSQDVFLL